jgi:hypothetical protein
MKSETDNINRFLDEQLLDLEQKFNLFMKEMENDLIFPSFISNASDNDWDDDFLSFEDQASEPKKHLVRIDTHTTVLCVTGSITVTILVYLGMVLSS